MRNLKRALSLALASVMVLGMMVVGASATSFDDFSDKDKVVNKEAVSTLVELNVINGKEDGAFDPTGIITRAEMAKLICTVLNGGKDPNLGSNVVTTYTDTAANWAAGYIEYCTTKGIVNGDGTGKFNPTNTVTGQEAAKMLLVAAGYQSAIEGYTGASWANSVNVEANKTGLYDGLTIDPSLGLTRDNAAQMVYNALGINVVTYKYTMVSDGQGGFSSIPERVDTNSANQKKTVLEDKFGVVTVEGVVLGNEFAILDGASTMDAGETRILVTNYGDGQDTYGGSTAAANTMTFKVSTGAEELGRTVNIFVKPATTSANSSTRGTVIGGVMVTSDNKVVVDSGRDSIATVVKDNKLSVEVTTAPKTQIADNYSNAADLTTAIRDAEDKTTGGIRGQVRTFIDNNDDGVVDYILTESYQLGKVTKYTTKDDGEITLNGASALNFDDKDDVVGFDDVAKGDYVLYAIIGGKLHVEKADSIKGELDSYDTNKSLTIDGEKINTSDLGFYADGSTLKKAGSYSTLDKTATFYKDKQGNIIAVDGTAASNSYAFLIKAADLGGTSDDIEVKVVLDDGTTGTYILDQDNSSGISNSSTNLLCTYTVSDDSIALDKVTPTGGEQDDTTMEIKKGNATISGVSGAFADASTVYFYIAPKGTYTSASDSIASNLVVDSVNVYSGKDSASSLSSMKRDFLYFKDGSTIKAIAVVTDGIGGSSDYVYLYQRTGRNSNGYLYNAIVNGEMETGVVVTTDPGTGLYNYTKTTKDYFKVSSITGVPYNGNIERLDGNSVVIGGVEYTLTGDTVIGNIDGGDTAIEDVVLNEGDYVAFKYDTDKKLTGIFVELVFDNEKVALDRNNTSAPAGTTVNVGDDSIEIKGTAINGTALEGLLDTARTSTGESVSFSYADASGADKTASDSIGDGWTVTVTFSKTFSNTNSTTRTMVKDYTVSFEA